MALKELQIRHARAADKVTQMTDERGLYLEVHPNGSKLWRYKYRYMGKQKRLALGRYPEVGLAEARRRASERLSSLPAAQLPALFAALMERVEVSPDTVTLHIRLIELVRLLEWEGQGAFAGRPADWPTSRARHAIQVPVSVIAAERWPVFTVLPCEPSRKRKPDKQLILLLRNARAALQFMETNRELDLHGLARGFGRSPGYFSRLVRLNYLAPDILAAIADGTQPQELNRSTLASAHIPLDWAVQRRMFGFPEPRRPLTPRNLYGRGMWPAEKQPTEL